jgi:hypothetical protein
MKDRVYGETTMSKMKALVDLALKNSGDADRYCRRMTSYPNLAKFGCLPQKLTEISNHEPPWFCHGLAFRMTTYSDASDDLFDRWETLLKLPQQAEGWHDEYKHWSNSADHWAKKWDKFHHFLWLLQCYEYFSQRGHIVSFPASNNEAKPDLLIKRQGQEEIYAECFFYSKWWPREFYFENLIHQIDENLSIKRIYNVGGDATNNPFYSDDRFTIALDTLATALTQNSLVNLRFAAQQASPQKVCEIVGFSILLEGDGEYQPSANAHGDAAFSFPVYLKEIITAKKDSNNLKGSRPNMVMVNALGLDFQFSFPESLDQVSAIAELPGSIDEIWISVCGIDEKLNTCPRVLKKLSNGYAGSGF